jgi:hypothetical protein
MKPPHLRVLLEDPAYRAYMKVIPRLSPSLTAGQPWAVWARNAETGRWSGGKFADYREAWSVVIKAMRNPAYEDVAIISRRQMFGPPDLFWWDQFHYDWCGRCRRPSSFATRPNHHALRGSPVWNNDTPDRCYFCGISQSAMPGYR